MSTEPFTVNEIEIRHADNISEEVIKEINAYLSPAWTRREFEIGRIVPLPVIIRKHHPSNASEIEVDVMWLYTNDRANWDAETKFGRETTFKPRKLPPHLR